MSHLLQQRPVIDGKGYAMACRITDDVVNALQHCRLKAFFQLRGEAGVQCGYEKLLVE
jgi:hypothetical protein